MSLSGVAACEHRYFAVPHFTGSGGTPKMFWCEARSPALPSHHRVGCGSAEDVSTEEQGCKLDATRPVSGQVKGPNIAARQVLRNFVGGTAGGEGRGLACREASGNARSPVERGALGSKGGALPSRLVAATWGQAARSYSWTMPSRTSRRVIAPPSEALTGWGIGWASCRPRCGLAWL